MDNRKKVIGVSLTERDTELTEQSGVEKFCWQTMIPLHVGGASNHLHRQAAMFLQRRLENCRISSWKDLRKGKCPSDY